MITCRAAERFTRSLRPLGWQRDPAHARVLRGRGALGAHSTVGLEPTHDSPRRRRAALRRGAV